jgi:hypothetical protein
MTAKLTVSQKRVLDLIIEHGSIEWDFVKGSGIKGFNVTAVSKLRKLELVTREETATSYIYRVA